MSLPKQRPVSTDAPVIGLLEPCGLAVIGSRKVDSMLIDCSMATGSLAAHPR